MQIGTPLLVKHNGKIKKGRVEKIYPEDLDIKLENGELIRRKFWEVRVVTNEKKD